MRLDFLHGLGDLAAVVQACFAEMLGAFVHDKRALWGDRLEQITDRLAGRGELRGIQKELAEKLRAFVRGDLRFSKRFFQFRWQDPGGRLS